MKSDKFECRGKEKYYTKREAEQEIYRIMVESLAGTTGLRTYKCKYCEGYHLTSKF
jgi:hypothetical protein